MREILSNEIKKSRRSWRRIAVLKGQKHGVVDDSLHRFPQFP